MVKLLVDESRRLTGPNLLSDNPGAVMEVFVEPAFHGPLIALWKKQLEQLLRSLNLNAELYHRRFSNGINLGFSADEDILYTACEINEAALELARAEIADDSPDAELTSLSRLAALLNEERNPQLMSLIKAANQYKVTYLVDDDDFSLGMGPSCQVWPITELPEVGSLDWTRYKDIPVALITGTNGKSTSVRMCDAIVKASGVSAGITSTDYIRAADTIIDRGDYSGPGGARTLIRDHRVELALLEVARGGMLRRGIGTSTAKAALITNVADDHLGQYGIDTVADLIGVKAIVARALSSEGTLVVNADDQGLVDYFKQHPELIRGKICWFSLDAKHPKILEQLSLNQACLWIEDRQLLLADGGKTESIIDINDIPTSMQGAAKHNVSNSLGAAGLCYALGISFQDITTGLKAFRGDNNDNPGRGNYFDIDGVTVLVDFAHNAHSLSAVIDTVAAMPANGRLIMLGHAGDRTDRDIINLTDVAHTLKPDAVITVELSNYLRGREIKEIPELIKKRLLEKGLEEQQIFYAESSFDGAKLAIDWAKPGDFVLLLALDGRDEIFEYLNSLS
ncbi:MAG: Mur ligase [Gammaproteobacteria bacterium]|nr:MAG: Mur ligase [Gammaproteobacteria bacterium]